MNAAQAETLFSTARLEMIFLSPALATAADQAVLDAPKFFEAEFQERPAPGFVADLLNTPPPPGVSQVAIFPIGIKQKGVDGFIGLAHLVMGYPTETTLFIGLFILGESNQRKGYGKEFVQGVFDWVRPQGVEFLRVRVHPRHTGARAFLDHLGFADLPTKLSAGHEVWERKLPAVEE